MAEILLTENNSKCSVLVNTKEICKYIRTRTSVPFTTVVFTPTQIRDLEVTETPEEILELIRLEKNNGA